jgi:hypothetical protein
MLVELSVMEQRYQAVLAVVQNGWTVSEGDALSESVALHECGGEDSPNLGARAVHA